jgi:hypothetical protein
MREIRFYPLVLFLTGIVLGIPLNLVGNLLAGELILGVFGLIGLLANFNNPAFLDRRLIIFTALFMLSLCVYMGTDFLWQTDLRDAARGWARFVFLIVDFVGIYIIGRKSRFNLFPLFIGYMSGQIMVWARPQSGFGWYIKLWKYHLCLPILIGALCIVGLYAKRTGTQCSIALLTITGIVSFQMDTRSFGLICFLAAALMAARMIVIPRIQRLMPFILILTLLATAVGVNAILNETHDRFGKRQLGSNEFRYAAMMTAFQTIASHPWFGIGSWKTDFETANRHRANLIEAGGKHDGESYNQSGHSQLLQVWVEGGPLAAVAFFYLLWRMLRALQWTLSRPVDRFLAFAMIILLNGIWSCLFSPFLGADMRVNAAVSIYVCIVLMKEKMNLIRAHA